VKPIHNDIWSSLACQMPTLTPNKPSNLDTHANTRSVPSSSLRVGDRKRTKESRQIWFCCTLLTRLGRVSFGRTNWMERRKLRVAVPECQKLDEGDLIRLDAEIYGNWSTFLDGQILNVLQPTHQLCKDIHTFVGTFTMNRPHQLIHRFLSHFTLYPQLCLLLQRKFCFGQT